MLLSGQQIIEKKIIDDVGPKSLREASYDVRIGSILAKPSDSVRSNAAKRNTSVISTDEYELPPQGMVEVISLERFTIPSGVQGYATVKTHLSDECVLALGIGLIDPGYDSYISSTLVNFGTQPFHLKKGHVFLRVTFHQYKHSGDDVNETSIELDDYSEAKRDKVLTRFSDTFLNLSRTVDKALDGLWGRVWWRVGLIAAVAALVVAVATAIGSIGIGMLGSRFISAPDAQVEELRSSYNVLKEQNSKLQEQCTNLQTELQEVSKSQNELQKRFESQHPKK